MAEYIEKDRIYKLVAEKEETARNWVLDTPTNSPAYMRYVAQLNERTAFKHMVADIPAADVVEVKHGRWINPEDPTCYKCSACGKYRNQRQGYAAPIFDKYCPNCGAKMDGGRER